jgi:hypothetical protein
MPNKNHKFDPPEGWPPSNVSNIHLQAKILRENRDIARQSWYRESLRRNARSRFLREAFAWLVFAVLMSVSGVFVWGMFR